MSSSYDKFQKRRLISSYFSVVLSVFLVLFLVGILGLFVTILFCVFWIIHLIRSFNWAKKTNESMRLWGGSLSAWVATFGIGFFNTTFHHEHAILACLFLGLYLSHTSEFHNEK